MTVPLLQTKFFAPPLRQNLLLRPRLLAKLHAGRACKLTLVAAPAGFGKTTVICGWLQQEESAAAWLSLDENDNDLYRFLHYLVEALQRVAPSMGEATLTLLRQRRLMPQEISVELLLTSLVNDCAAIAHAQTLVLDDYHLIEDASIHSALTFLLDHLPRQLHLVITSRTNPPLPLARLRAQGELSQLRAADLRFTLEEVSDFFQPFAHGALLPEQLAILAERTEGWIAGLQLAALSLEQRADVADFIQNFSGSDRFILDYLIEEVLEQRSAEIQSFLLYTSILGRMCAPLCATVMGILPGSVTGELSEQAAWLTLQQLAQANLFIVPLDDDQRWYRYHHLFAEMLRQRLRQLEPHKVALLHQRASLWFEREGLLDEAIQHAWSANDIPRVARLMEQELPTLIKHSYFDKAIQWMASLPRAIIESRPRLSLAQAWLRLLEIPIGDVDASLRHAEAALAQEPEQTPEVTTDLLGEIAAMRAIVAGYSGQAERSLAFAQEAFRLTSPNNHFIRGTVAYMLASNDHANNEWEQLQASFESATRSAQASDNVVIAVAAFYNLAMLQAEHGDLAGAAQRLQEAERFAQSQPNLWPWPLVDSARVGMGRILYERNEMVDALQSLQEGVHLAIQRRNLYVIIDGCVALAWLHQARGEVAMAQAALQQAIELLPMATRPKTHWVVMENQVRFWLREGKLAEAKSWATQHAFDPDDLPSELDPGLDDTLLLVVVRVLLAQGSDKAEQALFYLQRLEKGAGDWRGRLIPLLLLRALALIKLDRQGEALNAVARALALGESEGKGAGYVRLLVDEGAWLAPLIARLPATPYRERVLAAFVAEGQPAAEIVTPRLAPPKVAAPSSTPARTQPPLQPLVEPLSERELEVMRLVVAGASNKEIADQFFITVGTVKNHMSNILSKLGARNRWEARERVEELGLL